MIHGISAGSRGALAALAMLVPSLAEAQRSGRAMTLADWYRVTNLSSPALSPDGRRVA